MMTVALLVNMTRTNAYNVAVEVSEELYRIGINIVMPLELKPHFSSSHFDIVYCELNECINRCDIVIAIGGDGTIIHAAHDSVYYDKPILGINAGRLGFLAGLEKGELNLLENLITGNYNVDKRMRLSVKHYEGDKFIQEFTCLNDVIIARGNSLKLCEIDVKSDGRLLYNYLADGIISSTPTGSTAYSLSSGGPVVDTDIESLILTPICSHSLFSRSIIFKPDTELEFIVKNCDNSSPVFSCDGYSGVTMTENTRITVTRSERYTKIIRIKSDRFSDVLNNKLIERYTHC